MTTELETQAKNDIVSDDMLAQASGNDGNVKGFSGDLEGTWAVGGTERKVQTTLLLSCQGRS